MNAIEKPHIMAVPFPALGHAIPLLDFAKQLASHGLTVSCVTTAANLPFLQYQMAQAFSSGLDIHLLVLPTPPVEGLPEGIESFEQVPTHKCDLIFEMVLKLEHHFNRMLESQLEQGKGPVCIMHDLILGWSMEFPQKHNILRVVFDTYGAFGLSMMCSSWLSASQNAVGKQGDSVVLSLGLPTSMRFHKHEIDPELFEPFMVEFLARVQSIYQSSGILTNTFEKLEGEYIQNLRDLTGKKVWSIGPVLPPKFFSGEVRATPRGKMADISEDEVLQWLDSQSPSSVVYISFGSQTFLSEEQSKALASGLEASEKPFIWANKVSPKIESLTLDSPIDLARTYLPKGFQERTKNRGLVIWGWVSQLVILSHQSIGACMSHCGWNSMLESVALGVPLITWPMYADQHFNSKLAVKLGIGIQVCEHRDGIPDKKRVMDAVSFVLSKDEGKQMRRDAEKLKNMSRNAVAYGGSSSTNLQEFVSVMYNLNMSRKEVGREGSSKAELQEDIVSNISRLSISKTM
ncbi:hypothetical protein SUGI_0073520 [Cryptomeria japonica]|uniref:UDP-glucosyl transferase 73B2-like n=1 Tax=Cryptomeria japonica TaxID=3369 RepID=UPI002408EEDC|nr:UDP-glucosyl transferase 73B2-like [Cryptomeria japonica]GLJ07745.1 hypothetical protein SUGI_0073520 [Cryptomeria japonica]